MEPHVVDVMQEVNMASPRRSAVRLAHTKMAGIAMLASFSIGSLFPER